jgi:alkyl hydroperoxide reductase subunit AhpC
MTLAIGGRFIPFSLKNVDGRSLSSEELLKGRKAFAVVFWCNHCPYVQAWEDRMVQIGKEYLPKGAGFALINANDPKKYVEDDFDGMVRRAKTKGYPFPYLHDQDQTIARAYGATRTPEVFLFDAEGTLRYHGRIDDNYEDPKAVRVHELRSAVDAVLKGQPPPMTDIPPVGCTIKWK